jgi:hypothetical protein
VSVDSIGELDQEFVAMMDRKRALREVEDKASATSLTLLSPFTPISHVAVALQFHLSRCVWQGGVYGVRMGVWGLDMRLGMRLGV